MARGDQIYVMRPLMGMDGVYEHHGIDCGDGTVIHYSKRGDEPTIARTSYDVFSWNRPVFTKQYVTSYVPDVVVARAESRLGERQYNLMNNNCEHFATWCKVGRNESKQLTDYGLDVSRLDPFASRQWIREAEEGDPVKAMALYQQAMGNLTVTQNQLQAQYNRAQDQVLTWHRTADLALKRGREDLARAALERKVKFKREAEKIQNQLAQLIETQETLKRNTSTLKQQIR
ncbi:hypothetical protein C7B61_15260 [filamentous cyanobacterium CCP1]|nr:hypothetical protein C7B76_22280 [filamentous cyanobacterium CCP2]PSB61908.1 hypothetical protein C7B61_15260 [filamentous cyanobacterium CCP1]